ALHPIYGCPTANVPKKPPLEQATLEVGFKPSVLAMIGAFQRITGGNSSLANRGLSFE
ncbi:hypothetical protein J1N35_013984, partial [Gossypium stocksii]